MTVPVGVVKQTVVSETFPTGTTSVCYQRACLRNAKVVFMALSRDTCNFLLYGHEMLMGTCFQFLVAKRWLIAVEAISQPCLGHFRDRPQRQNQSFRL